MVRSVGAEQTSTAPKQEIVADGKFFVQRTSKSGGLLSYFHAFISWVRDTWNAGAFATAKRARIATQLTDDTGKQKTLAKLYDYKELVALSSIENPPLKVLLNQSIEVKVAIFVNTADPLSEKLETLAMSAEDESGIAETNINTIPSRERAITLLNPATLQEIDQILRKKPTPKSIGKHYVLTLQKVADPTHKKLLRIKKTETPPPTRLAIFSIYTLHPAYKGAPIMQEWQVTKEGNTLKANVSGAGEVIYTIEGTEDFEYHLLKFQCEVQQKIYKEAKL